MSRPVFIVGSGRSGTTAVLKLAANSEGCEGIPRLSGAYPQLSPLTATWVRSPLPVPERVATPSSECIGWFREAGFVPDAIGSNLPQQLSDHLDEVETLRRRVESWTSRSAVAVTLVKSTASIVRVPALAAGIPEASFVHVLRHPASVAKSLAAVGFFPDMGLWWADGLTPNQLTGNDPSLLASVGLSHWFHQVSTGKAGFDELPAERQFEFRYEAPDPEALARFLGVPTTSMVESFAGFRSGGPAVVNLDWDFVSGLVDPDRLRALAAEVGYEL